MEDIDQLMADANAQSDGSEIEILTRPVLSRNGDAMPFDVGITILIDFVMSLGFFPPVSGWLTELPDGRRYVFVCSS